MQVLLYLLCLLIPFGLKAQHSLNPGDIAPSFNLKNINGKTVSPDDYPSAKGFIVVFTCNTCPYSQAYESRIIDLNNQYSSKGFPVLAINPNDPLNSPGDAFDEMQRHAKTSGFNFPYLYDDGQKITLQFGVRTTPQVFVISKAGSNNVVEYSGAIDNDTPGQSENKTKYVEDAVNALLQHKKPPVTVTKAIGCRVKFKS